MELETKETVIKTLEFSLSSIVTALQTAALEEERTGIEEFVIMCDGLTIQINADGRAEVCPTQTAPRYTAEKARKLAQNVRNGRGTRGAAVPLTAALRINAVSLQELIGTLRAEVYADAEKTQETE